jgi:2'-5' RNA ligase
MTGIAICPSLYYSPTKWIPHITLAYNDVNLTNLECALKTLANQSYEWEIKIDNIVSIVQDRDRLPETVRYCFGL